jgi:lipoprotein NlpD
VKVWRSLSILIVLGTLAAGCTDILGEEPEPAPAPAKVSLPELEDPGRPPTPLPAFARTVATPVAPRLEAAATVTPTPAPPAAPATTTPAVSLAGAPAATATTTQTTAPSTPEP